MTPEIEERIAQLRRGETPDGYKRTKAGIMPHDWTENSVGNCVREYKRLSNDIASIPVYSSSRKGLILQSEYYDQKEAAETNLGYKVVPQGYVTYRHMSDDDIFHFNVNKTNGEILVSSEYPVFTASEDCDLGFLIPALNETPRFRYFCRTQKLGGTRTRLYFHNLAKYRLGLPPLAEQRKIADILSAQDKIIELKERLLTEKQRQKKYLMQRLLTGKQRLPGFSGEWKAIALKEYGFCIRGVSYHPKEDLRERKTSDSCLLYRANNITDGTLEETNVLFVDKNKVSSAQIIQQGDILIAMSSGSKKAVGKSAYVRNVHTDSCVGAFCAVFRSPYNDYCRHLFSSAIYDKNLSILLEGSNILNLNGGDIENMRFKVPSDISEQRAIGEILSTADREIDLLRRGLEQEKRVKKSLSQLLLTGIVRV